MQGVDAGSAIREVWADNLDSEMAVLRDLVDTYPYLAMDTEFPGVVARPIGNFRTSADYHYQTLRCNVDLLKIIQLGITLADERGNLPPGVCTWQFNFKFSIQDDMYAQDSIDLLTKSGIDFQKHEDYGIDVRDFGELLMMSGLVLSDEVKWISFHSGYDFGYLLKVLTCLPLPADEAEFFELLKIFFPCIYDIKYLMKSCKSLKGGLQDVADDLQVSRIGPQHQAGSDSLLTCTTFYKMRQTFFDDKIDDEKFLGFLYGLGTGSTQASATGNAIGTSGVSTESSSMSMLGAVSSSTTAVSMSADSAVAKGTNVTGDGPASGALSAGAGSSAGVVSGTSGTAAVVTATASKLLGTSTSTSTKIAAFQTLGQKITVSNPVG